MTDATTDSAGGRLRAALGQERPLQIAGAVNAYFALLAERAGFRALYLSGAGVANASFGLPDLGIINLADVVEDARRITAATGLPLLVDVDTGFGEAFGIARTVRELTRAGAAGIQIEDQVSAKRCGHRPGKQLVGSGEMVDRIKAAADARTDGAFVIVARTDALAGEGLEPSLERAKAYVAAGADWVFPEAVTTLDGYRGFVEATGVPVLANLTEFGQTPLLGTDELASAGVACALYPLSAFRAASAAALRAYRTVRRDGTQAAVVEAMQTRAELYDVLGYHAYERKLDELFGNRG